MPENNFTPPKHIAVEFKNVAKQFGDCVANSNVSFAVPASTIHGIVGENGAGKSTAMKMLFGLYKPTSGDLFLHGQKIVWNAPSAAIAAGIGMVHQHFMLSGPFTVLDNILLGAEPSYKGFAWLPALFQPVNEKQARAELAQIMNQYNLHVDLNVRVETLPVGLQQRVEILKLLYRRAQILILDEPTAVLTPQETEDLFKNLERLRREGKTILIITHKLKEVIRITNNVSIFRQGCVVADLPTVELNEQKLADLMVGRRVNLSLQTLEPKATSAGFGEVVAQLSNVNLHKVVSRSTQKSVLSDLNLQVKKGEIVGIAGVEGNGQSELLQILLHPKFFFGRQAASAGNRFNANGTYKIKSTSVEHENAAQIKGRAVAFIPEDRHHQGLLLGQSAQNNFILGQHRRPAFLSAGFLNNKKIGTHLRETILAFDIRPPQPHLVMSSFSGGNQQKLIIARELHNKPEFIIAAQPTRGVDVGAIEFIHQKLFDASRNGAGVLLVSSELDEIFALSDRIFVMFDGKFVAEFQRGNVNIEQLGLAMGGALQVKGAASVAPLKTESLT